MTAQVPETLIYEGQKHSMCAEPLAMYFQLMNMKVKFLALNSACWRGYRGTWEVKDDRLYLVDFQGQINFGQTANLEMIFPGFPDRVFAHWFTGRVRLPQGRLLEYIHGGYASTYEKDLFLTFENGVLKSKFLKENGTSTDPAQSDGYAIGAFTTLGG